MRAADVVLANTPAIALRGAGAAVSSGGGLRHRSLRGSRGAINFPAPTLEYLKTRKQFGVPIGTFQALQHRIVDMYVAYEQAKSMAFLACSQTDSASNAKERSRTISAAKIKIADNARLISQEAIQLHGGMGMSEELKVSHSFRRLTMIAQQFGDADHHLERFAKSH